MLGQTAQPWFSFLWDPMSSALIQSSQTERQPWPTLSAASSNSVHISEERHSMLYFSQCKRPSYCSFSGEKLGWKTEAWIVHLKLISSENKNWFWWSTWTTSIQLKVNQNAYFKWNHMFSIIGLNVHRSVRMNLLRVRVINLVAAGNSSLNGNNIMNNNLNLIT